MERFIASRSNSRGRASVVSAGTLLRLSFVLACAIPAGSPAQARPVANLIVGDGVVVVKSARDGRVYIGAGTAAHTTALVVRGTAAREFASEVQAIVRLGTRRFPPHLMDQPVLQADTTAHALSLTRHLDRVHGRTILTYHVFVSDDRLSGFVLVATPTETKALVSALQRAAVGSLQK